MKNKAKVKSRNKYMSLREPINPVGVPKSRIKNARSLRDSNPRKTTAKPTEKNASKNAFKLEKISTIASSSPLFFTFSCRVCYRNYPNKGRLLTTHFFLTG